MLDAAILDIENLSQRSDRNCFAGANSEGQEQRTPRSHIGTNLFLKKKKRLFSSVITQLI